MPQQVVGTVSAGAVFYYLYETYVAGKKVVTLADLSIYLSLIAQRSASPCLPPPAAAHGGYRNGRGGVIWPFQRCSRAAQLPPMTT